MNLKSLSNFFNKIDLDKLEDINSLHVAEQKFFGRNGDYRQKAWGLVCGYFLPFSFSVNALSLFSNSIVVKCPYCERNMKSSYPSSSGHGSSFNYICEKCNATCSIEISDMSFNTRNIDLTKFNHTGKYLSDPSIAIKPNEGILDLTNYFYSAILYSSPPFKDYSHD